MRWRPVVGFEGFYEVSDRGQVRSVERLVAHYQAKSGFALRKSKVLKPAVVGRYQQVMLWREGVDSQIKVHALVLGAFHGPRPEGHVARHLDGNAMNNHWRNLCWGTSQENSDDMRRHGTMLFGERSPTAKLTEAKVRQIRRLLAKRVRQADIAARFGISSQQVNNINCGRAWTHVKS